MNEYILFAKHIKKRYGKHTVLNDVSFRVKKGEIYGLVGKNGSGKTTIFRILTGLIHDYCGEVSITNVENRKTRISAVIDSPSVYLNMNAFENMKAQCFLLGIRGNTHINQMLRKIGLSEHNKQPIKNYSLGMTQRLKLGMALLANPDVLILDEPANGLDPDGIVELRELLLHLNRSNGITIIVSSHILSELAQIVTCLGVLYGGKIVKEVTNSEILQDGLQLEKLYMEYTRGGGSNE